jgi:hemerythrin-like domain-containing protein
MPNHIEEAMSKAAGKVKAATARVKGLTGVFNHLAEEHAQATSLLKLTKAASDPSKQGELWSALRKEILAHERAELLHVYPVLERHEATRDMAERHREEAAELELALANVGRSNVGTAQWFERFAHLEEVVKKHIEEEEQQLFPLAQSTVDRATSDDLRSRFESTKMSLMESL